MSRQQLPLFAEPPKPAAAGKKAKPKKSRSQAIHGKWPGPDSKWPLCRYYGKGGDYGTTISAELIVYDVERVTCRICCSILSEQTQLANTMRAKAKKAAR